MIKNQIEVCVLIFLFALIGCSERRGKTGEEKNKQYEPEYAIAYIVLYNDSTDNYEVFTMNLDGTEKRNVRNLDGVEWSYYSYKNKLYFISDKDICQRCAYYLYETNFKGDKQIQHYTSSIIKAS